MKALCFALFACAFNLLIGYVGLASFGHAMFFGWASYVTCYAAKTWGWTPELAMLAGGATAAVLGVVAGGLAIRRQGIYFAMITLALAQMMYFFALEAKFTGGEDGIQGVPRGRLFGVFDLSHETTMYVFILVAVLAGFLLIYRIINSPFGEVLKAIRENEQRAISLGYNSERYKLVAFVLSATLSGLAGSLNGVGLSTRFSHRCALGHVGRRAVDDLARRPRHRVRAGGRRLYRDRDAELSGAVRPMGAGDAGRDFHCLRAHVPARGRRRACPRLARSAVSAAALLHAVIPNDNRIRRAYSTTR